MQDREPNHDVVAASPEHVKYVHTNESVDFKFSGPALLMAKSHLMAII